MGDSHARDAIRQAQARRISTDDAPVGARDETVGVAVEARVGIDVERVDTFTLLCTPNDKRALAAGFLLSEGIIDSMEDVAILKECDDDPDVIRVRLNRQIPRIGDPGRNLLIVSSCGVCGSEDLDTKINALPEVGDTLRLPSQVLRTVGDSLAESQPLFAECGGTHAAAIFDVEGTVIASAEDTGRHNALDKAIGKCLLAGLPTTGRAVFMSGRVSLEMVGKCARAGIELIAAVSAPTSLALDVCERCKITLCAFVRETRATVFCCAHRVLGAQG